MEQDTISLIVAITGAMAAIAALFSVYEMRYMRLHSVKPNLYFEPTTITIKYKPHGIRQFNLFVNGFSLNKFSIYSLPGFIKLANIGNGSAKDIVIETKIDKKEFNKLKFIIENNLSIEGLKTYFTEITGSHSSGSEEFMGLSCHSKYGDEHLLGLEVLKSFKQPHGFLTPRHTSAIDNFIDFDLGQDLCWFYVYAMMSTHWAFRKKEWVDSKYGSDFEFDFKVILNYFDTDEYKYSCVYDGKLHDFEWVYPTTELFSNYFFTFKCSIKIDSSKTKRYKKDQTYNNPDLYY